MCSDNNINFTIFDSFFGFFTNQNTTAAIINTAKTMYFIIETKPVGFVTKLFTITKRKETHQKTGRKNCTRSAGAGRGTETTTFDRKIAGKQCIKLF